MPIPKPRRDTLTFQRTFQRRRRHVAVGRDVYATVPRLGVLQLQRVVLRDFQRHGVFRFVKQRTCTPSKKRKEVSIPPPTLCLCIPPTHTTQERTGFVNGGQRIADGVEFRIDDFVQTRHHETGPGRGNVPQPTAFTTVVVRFRGERFPHERLRRVGVHAVVVIVFKEKQRMK